MIVPGLISIEFLDTDGIASFDLYHTADGFSQVLMTLHPPYTWLSVSERPIEKRRMEMKPVTHRLQGAYCEVKVFDAAAIDALSIARANGMQEKSYLLRVEDANGNRFLVGTPDTPMRFKYDYSSAQAALDIEWYGKTRFPPNQIL
jgi:hypothetical protein